MLVILNFLRRGHQLTIEGGGPNVPNTENMPPMIAHWRAMFAQLLERVSYGRTLPPLRSRPFMWELALALSVDANDRQKQLLADSLREEVSPYICLCYRRSVDSTKILSLPNIDQIPSAMALRTALSL